MKNPKVKIQHKAGFKNSRKAGFQIFSFARKHGGFTLVEITVYVAILSILTVAAVNTILIIRSSLGQIKAVRTLSQTEALVMSRITRAVRDAKSVNAAASAFDVSPGVLALTGPGIPPASRVFSLSGGSVWLKEDALEAVALTPPGIIATSLIFRYAAASTTSQAVKIEMTLGVWSGRATTTQNVYGTAVLRNSYTP